MSSPTGADATSILKPLSRAASVAAILVGWALDIAPLKSGFLGLVTMTANTAPGFILPRPPLRRLKE